MKDGFYIYTSGNKREVFEIKTGDFYTHKIYRRFNRKEGWVEQKGFIRPTKFGPVSAAAGWLKDNEHKICEYTKEDMFLLML